jgi:hypothetical protein
MDRTFIFSPLPIQNHLEQHVMARRIVLGTLRPLLVVFYHGSQANESPTDQFFVTIGVGFRPVATNGLAFSFIHLYLVSSAHRDMDFGVHDCYYQCASAIATVNRLEPMFAQLTKGNVVEWIALVLPALLFLLMSFCRCSLQRVHATNKPSRIAIPSENCPLGEIT